MVCQRQVQFQRARYLYGFVALGQGVHNRVARGSGGRKYRNRRFAACIAVDWRDSGDRHQVTRAFAGNKE